MYRELPVTSPKLARSLSGCLRCYTQTTTDPIHLAWMVNQVGWLEPNQRATKTPPGSSGGESGCLSGRILPRSILPPSSPARQPRFWSPVPRDPEKRLEFSSPEKIPTQRNPKSSPGVFRRQRRAARQRSSVGPSHLYFSLWFSAPSSAAVRRSFRHTNDVSRDFARSYTSVPIAKQETCPICNFDMRNALCVNDTDPKNLVAGPRPF